MSVDSGSDNFEELGNVGKLNDVYFEFLAKAFVIAFILVMTVGFMNYILAISIDDVQVG